MEKRILTIENIIGEAKGTPLERVVKQNFTGETKEVGIYLAMANLAQRQGYPEIALILKEIAMEEAQHAARFAEMNGMINEDIFENIKQMLEGETFANREKREASIKADELGLESLGDYLNESSKDEGRHARILEGILNRYSK